MVESLINELQNNNIALGLISASIITSLIVILKKVPILLYHRIIRLLKHSIILNSTQPCYHPMREYISNLLENTRLKTITVDYNHNNPNLINIRIGPGTHYFYMSGCIIRFERISNETKDNYFCGPTETISIDCFGFNSWNTLNSLINQVTKIYQEENQKEPRIINFTSNNQDSLLIARQLDTIYIDNEIKIKLLSIIGTFLSSESWYRERGIPYRLGILLHGPPGTGKTSLITALAKEFKKDLCVLNLASCHSDRRFLELIHLCGDQFVILEDVDAANIISVGKRETAANEDRLENSVSFSGLLNGIDGVTATEGRVLFMTSNHPEVLDDALLRPGRIDYTFCIGLSEENEAIQMYKRFYPDNEYYEKYIKEIIPNLPMSAAEMQNTMLSWRQN